jgi:hypothetical protein
MPKTGLESVGRVNSALRNYFNIQVYITCVVVFRIFRSEVFSTLLEDNIVMLSYVDMSVLGRNSSSITT